MNASLSMHIASLGFVLLVMAIGLVAAARLEADLARAEAPRLAAAE